MKQEMGCSDGAETPMNQFALVSYIPDPLGKFLDQLRLELVPGCSPHAHVTILPPRTILADESKAASELIANASDFSDFEVELGDVEVFPVSKVVFIGIKRGERELREMYRSLNRGAVKFTEPFPYHPHVTLAQKFPVEDFDRVYELALRRWAEYRYTRSFAVDTLAFVKNLYGNHWQDLASIHLNKMHAGVL
jgi:2'-5' RNA ligase